MQKDGLFYSGFLFFQNESRPPPSKTSRTGNAAPRVRRTLHGRELESAGPDAATLLAYDGFGRAVSRTVTNAAGTVSTTAVVHDTLGNAVTNETTYGTLTAVTATGYDSQGRAVSQTDVLGNPGFTAYDRAGNVTAQWGATHPVACEYDTQGRRIAMATTRDDTFDFSSVTNSSILNPNSSLDVTQWRYDAATGLLTNKVYADGSRIVYTHTPDGKPLRTTWARGAWKENAYDALGQLTTVTYGGKVPKVYHAYDVFGYVVASSNAVAQYEYANSLSGVATNETITINGDTVILTRELGERHHLSALHVGNAPVHYGYDAENRLAVTSNDAFTVTYALTADGWDAGYAVTLTNGFTITRAVTRDPHRRHLIGTITNAVNGTMANALSFEHDLLGRITNRNADTFGYNARSEVTSADIGSTASRYAYDSIGNNCWVSVNAVTNSYTANVLNQYTAAGSVFPVYDADGNMRWDGRMWHTWDAENRLVHSEPGWDGSTNSARRVVNRYDHMSRLVETRVEMLSGRGAGYPFDPSQGGTWDTLETRTFIYDGWLPVLEKTTRTGGVTETREHVWGKDLSGTRGGAGGVGGLLATRINDAWYFPLYDNNGNVTDYINESGATVAHREYGPFGETRAASGPMADAFSFWFSTKHFNTETGFYYYGYRFYSPELMRWLNRDPIGERGGLNEYGFVGNDPMNRWDRLGLISIAPVDDSPRVVTIPSEKTMHLWASAFVLLDELDKQAIADARGGTLVHGKRISVVLRKCDSGETIRESQALSKRLFLSLNSTPPYRTTQPSRDGNDYIYFNLLNKKVPDNCVKGTIEVLANWHLYPKGSDSPTFGATVADDVSGSLDGRSSHGRISSREGWPNVREHRSFSSGWFNFTIRIFCNGNWEVSASAVPLYPKPIGRVPPNDGSERVKGIGHDGWPWMR